MTRFLPDDVVEAVIERMVEIQQRNRLLPSRLKICCVMAWQLLASGSYELGNLHTHAPLASVFDHGAAG
ncbi:transposase domain-containing protein [Arthrobacter polaris]|uniref:transposase domain-containing protein n=1 Tax=Arthrobacter polaris TaxID=2813727 RepID=UPI0038991DCB|nr:transposase domain-containing protein [Arthrobacter polaris]